MTIEEQINKYLEALSINSKERTNRVVNYINAIDMKGFIRGKKNLKTIRKSQRTSKKNLKMKENQNNVRKIFQAMDTTQEKTN